MKPGSPVIWTDSRSAATGLPRCTTRFCETSPAPVKYAAHLLGKTAPECRLQSPARAGSGDRARCAGQGWIDQLTHLAAAGAYFREHGECRRNTEGATVAQNRRARFDYHIEDTVEAGMVLTGTEVKSLQSNSASLGNPTLGRRTARFTSSTRISRSINRLA